MGSCWPFKADSWHVGRYFCMHYCPDLCIVLKITRLLYYLSMLIKYKGRYAEDLASPERRMGSHI